MISSANFALLIRRSFEVRDCRIFVPIVALNKNAASVAVGQSKTINFMINQDKNNIKSAAYTVENSVRVTHKLDYQKNLPDKARNRKRRFPSLFEPL